MNINAELDCNTGCWLWSGSIAKNGYGRIGPKLAHRVMYERIVGDIMSHLEIDHLCNNKSCVNPMHLEQVTHLQNMQRTKSGLCRRGHILSSTTVRVYTTAKDGYTRTQCKLCESIRRLKANEV